MINKKNILRLKSPIGNKVFKKLVVISILSISMMPKIHSRIMPTPKLIPSDMKIEFFKLRCLASLNMKSELEKTVERNRKAINPLFTSKKFTTLKKFT